MTGLARPGRAGHFSGGTSVKYDYIIAGGGSSACVAAARLVSEFGARVLLVERGPARCARLMRMPAGYMKYLGREDFLEMHKTVAQPRLNGRAPIVPQAKVLGGGSSVNAMVYMRGQQADYDHWDTYLGGDSGWSYKDLLPHFTSLENNRRLNDAYHGTGGKLLVSDPGQLCEMTEDFILAAQAMGLPFNADFNGSRQNGVGIMQHTMGKAGGAMRRSDAVFSFLADAMRDKRLTVVTDALVSRIIVENGRAVGIDYTHEGRSERATASEEVLVATGTYNTAKLLMLSGIGPASHLAEHGIRVEADLPGVGQNLQDHHEVPVICSSRRASGYFGQDKGWNMIRNGLQYLLFGTGPVTTTGIESCLFYDPDGGERPTIQLYCAPIVYLDRDITDMKSTHGVTLTSCLLRPKARGSVKLRSDRATDQPIVDSNFFGEDEDLQTTIRSLRFARRLLAAEPIASNIAAEMLPGRDVESDEALAQHCYRFVKTNYHPCGTAKMGPDSDPMAVLDSQLRVRGVEALRVIDCASVPFIPSGNTNAIALALGSKAVSLIQGK
ncbi:GMC family oxidoreductase [Kaistia sp. MMO-174]|uniref:GMC family oxidoreductase n=1 Tax=Kaistia sp. MMO-174 TaxID=3081256 RepID=UPI003016801A